MKKCMLFLLTFIYLLNNVGAYKILVAFPYPGKSHTILGEGYVRHLLEAGHQVTYITPIPLKKPHPNLRQVDVSSNLPKFELNEALNFKTVIENGVLTDLAGLYELMAIVANRSITYENVQKLLMDPNEQYDLVIAEWLYHNLYSGFAAVFNCPYVWSSSVEPHPTILSLIDEFGNPAYFTDLTSVTSLPLSFSQRVAELWNLIEIRWVTWSIRDTEEKLFRDAFGLAAAKRGVKLPKVEEFKYNSSMVFGNSHVSSGEAHRLPINYKAIGGYHIEDEIPPLPENLKKILDNAPNGVIYFSMGSMMKSRTMPMELKRDFLKVFSELKETVIWKLEEEFTDVPKNVHVVQWAPQRSILAHPNCKLFVTHGGLLSTTETLHFGVPIIGIPLFADQFFNVRRAVQKGFAIQVDVGYDTPAKLKVAIDEMFANTKYREKVKELSFIYHHRPIKPGKEMVHWVEHVIATRGALHLRSPALHVPLYQKLYLDLIALIFLAGVVLVRMAGKLFCSMKNSDLKQKRS